MKWLSVWKHSQRRTRHRAATDGAVSWPRYSVAPDWCRIGLILARCHRPAMSLTALRVLLQTAIAGTLFSSVILSATLCYLWRNDPQQRALLFWSLAFAAQTLRMAAQFGVTLGHQGLVVLPSTSCSHFVALCSPWLLAPANFEQRPRRPPIVAGAARDGADLEFVVAAPIRSFFQHTFPMRAPASSCCSRPRHCSGSPVGTGHWLPGPRHPPRPARPGYYFDYPFLRNVPASPHRLRPGGGIDAHAGDRDADHHATPAGA